MTNRPDLIDTIKKLNLTEGEYINNVNHRVFVAQGDDAELITLAPQMRTAILDMAKEIERLQDIIDLHIGTGYY